jgi:putative membrane protein
MVFLISPNEEACLMQRIANFIALSVAMGLAGCSQICPFGPGTGPGSMHPWFGGGYFMWILLIILAVVVIYLVLQPRKGGGPPSSTETPMDILNKRYAAGEIDKEQYEDMKKDLQ